MTSVTFPSGVEITGLGPEARCMLCHQGRASKVQVDDAITESGVSDVDTVSEDLGFINIHYFAAAATLYGTRTKGGYEYEGKAYDYKNDHVAGYNTCVGCHNPHTLEIRLDQCAGCHQDVAGLDDLKNIRWMGSLVDYDGDGDIQEGIYYEVQGLQEMLYAAMQAYASQVNQTPLVYSPATYPYFFNDSNTNGQLDEDEAQAANGYASWTARLIKAAYNYQTSIKDPGAFAHGGKYIIELLYDSIEDLGAKATVDLSKVHRIDAGHFAGSEQPFRHWDAEEPPVVPGDCAKCHSASGLPMFLSEAAMSSDGVTGRNIAVNPSNGLNCATCHSNVSTFERFVIDSVKFPSGAIVTFGEGAESNLCIECHQGRESSVSVNSAVRGLADDEVSDRLRFRNPHYFAAGATLFGAEAHGAYEYEGKTYFGRNTHTPAFNQCINCHVTHGLVVQVNECAKCHPSATGLDALHTIRYVGGEPEVDYDGDGNTEEGIGDEVATLHEALYAAIQNYAAEKLQAPILYNAASYPYFFSDVNANGMVDEGEGAFATWTPRLLKAAYNYQWVAKDPGAFAHNGKYIIQVLYDSLADLGATTPGMVRPEVPKQ
jgi:hypothetical protein